MSGYFDTPREQNIAVAQMCVKVMAGRELGFGPFAPSMDSRYQGQAGCVGKPDGGSGESNPRYDYRVRQMDNEAARVEFFEIVDGKRESLGISEFTRRCEGGRHAEYGQVRAQYDVRPCHVERCQVVLS